MNAMRGMALEPTTVASVNSFIIAAVLALFVLLGFNWHHVTRIFSSFFSDVWSNRQRTNIFEEHVATESRTMLLLLLQTSVLEGLLIYCFFRSPGSGHELELAGLMTVLATLFNIFSIVACRVVGYVFTDTSAALQWSRGLFASQAMLGLFLIVPSMVALVRPQYAAIAIIVAVIFYLSARLLYIVKGLRIFYTDLSSLIYFILYLCTLEIIPVLVLLRVAAKMPSIV